MEDKKSFMLIITSHSRFVNLDSICETFVRNNPFSPKSNHCLSDLAENQFMDKNVSLQNNMK